MLRLSPRNSRAAARHARRGGAVAKRIYGSSLVASFFQHREAAAAWELPWYLMAMCGEIARRNVSPAGRPSAYCGPDCVAATGRRARHDEVATPRRVSRASAAPLGASASAREMCRKMAASAISGEKAKRGMKMWHAVFGVVMVASLAIAQQLEKKMRRELSEAYISLCR